MDHGCLWLHDRGLSHHHGHAGRPHRSTQAADDRGGCVRRHLGHRRLLHQCRHADHRTRGTRRRRRNADAFYSGAHQQSVCRALAIGVWATMFALGMAMGPIVGGVLLEHFWWGAAFLVAVPVVVLLLFLAPVLLPEYRARQSGPIDLASVLLSLAAMLPVVYGIKEIAKHGFALSAISTIVTGILFSLFFVRRQRRLADPLLDLVLFANSAFSVALIVLLFGLVTVGGTMLLVTQYLQLVAGFSPLVAGLWMGPPALAMVAAGIGAPMLARYIRPGLVVAGALALSVTGYLMLMRLGNDATGLVMVVVGFSLAYLGLGTIAALGTDLVVGSAPAERAGSASAMSETVQDLGVSLGIALTGSLATAVYRQKMQDRIPVELSPEARTSVGDSLWAASAIAQELPGNLLEEAQSSFIAGVNTAGAISAVVVTILALLAAVGLRKIPPLHALPHGS